MTRDYLTTNIELESVKQEVNYKKAIKDYENLKSLSDEKEILKFIAEKLISIEQKLS